MDKVEIQQSYDRLALEYTKRIANELEYKPFDRELLIRFTAQLKGRGKVAEIGCGPGHVTGFLHQQGLEIVGLDLSPQMVAQAAKLNPQIAFEQADMFALPVPDQSWVGLVAFYSIIHAPRQKVVQLLQEFSRVLAPAGLLLLAFHRGQEIRHLEEMWGEKVSLDFIFFEPEEMAQYLQLAGFELVETLERAPYPEIEAQTQRVYILARKPTSL